MGGVYEARDTRGWIVLLLAESRPSSVSVSTAMSPNYLGVEYIEGTRVQGQFPCCRTLPLLR